jgi:GR25 family glycosyltransferase involved in LPS biosynthesis
MKSKLWKKDTKYRRLKYSEISCELKHIQALKLISESDSEYSLIIEDDIVPLSSRYISKIVRVLKKNKNWDLLFIGEGIGKKFILNKINKKFLIKSQMLNIDHPATNCAEAYLVKKEAASKIYNKIIPFNMAYDWELAYQIYRLNLKVNWYFPAIFMQGSIRGDYKSELR